MKCLEVPRSRLQWTETEDEKEARGVCTQEATTARKDEEFSKEDRERRKRTSWTNKDKTRNWRLRST